MELCVVYSVPIRECYADFLANIPIRIRRALDDSIRLSVLYNGFINERRIENEGIRVYRGPGAGGNAGLGPELLAATARAVYRLGASCGVDAFMNANNHLPLFAAACGARAAGRRVIARITGTLEILRPQGIRKLAKRRGKREIEKLSLRMAHAGICLAEHLRQRLVRLGVRAEKLVVLSQGVDTERFRPGDGYGVGVRRLLYVGRMSPLKGPQFVLEAFRELKGRHAGLEVVLCGAGEMLSGLARAHTRGCGVEFFGHVENEGLAEVYRNCDVLILPSLGEGLPNVILEGMASGIPVVASDVGDNRILLGEGQRGWLVRPGSVTEVVSAVESVMHSPEKARTMAQVAREYVERVHSFDAVRGRTSEVIRRVIENGALV